MNKFFKSKLAIVMVLLVAFSGFALVGCGKSSDDSTATTETVSSVPTDDEVNVVATQAPTEFKINKALLAKVYKPTEAFRNKESVSLDTVFGKGYAQYGDEMVFNEDGTFTAYIGVTASPDTVKGTYEINDDNEIVLLYDNDKTEVAVAVTFDLDENILQFRLQKGDAYVIFSKAE